MESLQAKSKELKNTIDSIKFDLFMDKDVGSILEIFDGIATYTRTYIDDFGSLNQILVTGIALMTKMFAPEIINKGINAFSKFKNEFNAFKENNQNANIFSFLNYKQQSQSSSIDTAFNNLKASITDTISQQNALTAVTETYGERAGSSFQNTINTIRSTSQALNQLNTQFSTRVFGQDFMGLNFADLRNNSEVLSNLTTNLNNLGIRGQAAQLVIKNLRREAYSSSEQFLTANDSIKSIVNTLNNLPTNIILSGKIRELITDINQFNAELERSRQKVEQ